MATEEELLKAHETAKLLMKNVLMPDVRAFGDLFLRATVVEDLSSYKSSITQTWHLDGGDAYLTSYCKVHDMTSGGRFLTLDVVPQNTVINMLSQHMLLSKDYRIHFEIIIREGGSALVTAKYDRILGDRWLAIIDGDSVPTQGELRQKQWMIRPDEDIRQTDTHKKIHQLLCRCARTYGMAIVERKAGVYVDMPPEKAVGKFVMVQLGADEYVWVQAIKTIDENGNQLAGRLANVPEKNKDFTVGDEVGLKMAEIVDVLSATGTPTNTSSAYDDQWGPDNIHILMRDHAADATYDTAKLVWFGMSDAEKEFMTEVFNARRNVIHAAIHGTNI